MGGCIFLVTGKDFNPDLFLRSSSWSKQSSSSQGCFQIDVSGYDDNLVKQVEDAIAFFEKNENELQLLRTFSGVENIEMRFGGWWHENTAAFMFSLPPGLVTLAARHRVEITVCVYAV